MGSCKPSPLYNYLGGIESTAKYSRDLFGTALTLLMIGVVLTMQVCIEVKKYIARRSEQQV
jgi:hypothetical protein